MNPTLLESFWPWLGSMPSIGPFGLLELKLGGVQEYVLLSTSRLT